MISGGAHEVAADKMNGRDERGWSDSDLTVSEGKVTWWDHLWWGPGVKFNSRRFACVMEALSQPQVVKLRD